MTESSQQDIQAMPPSPLKMTMMMVHHRKSHPHPPRQLFMLRPACRRRLEDGVAGVGVVEVVVGDAVVGEEESLNRQ